jgi:hypothetical protein
MLVFYIANHLSNSSVYIVELVEFFMPFLLKKIYMSKKSELGSLLIIS